MSFSLVVLFEDNHCLAVAKPAPLLTQGVPHGIPTLEAMAKDYLKTRYHKAGRVYLGIPHRLDRPVSGVILFARSTKAAQRLAEQFRERQVDKVYWALLEGDLKEPAGRWEDWLLKKAEEARTDVVGPDTPSARKAVTGYQPIKVGLDGTFVELRPETGRMHQLRVQAATRGHPVWGDRVYGASHDFVPPAADPRERIIALHARQLTFLHPIRYEPMTVAAPLPDYWPAWVRDSANGQVAQQSAKPDETA